MSILRLKKIDVIKRLSFDMRYILLSNMNYDVVFKIIRKTIKLHNTYKFINN